MQTEAPQRFHWAIIGPGNIAHQFAAALAGVPGAAIGCVVGRDAARAQAFAQRWQPAQAQTIRVSTQLADVLADPGIDGVYIATPHTSHAEHARACLLAGKPVLCEKPLTHDLAETRALVALARQQGVFLMEALWTRFTPLYRDLAERLAQGAIGELRAIQSSFCFNVPYDASSRMFDPALGGGALLDLGVYNIAMSRWAVAAAQGACAQPIHLTAQVKRAPTGVDTRTSAQLQFAGDLSAQFICGMDGLGSNGLHLFGSEGCIVVAERFWMGTEAVIHRGWDERESISHPFAVNGYEYEVLEAQRCIRAELTESPLMPLDETLAIMATLDAVRAAATIAP
ncbi:Gfo/Idh/MocA family protein [Ideonella sp.]|uniref:Gfo/Idh/MocA family protein n=1 Tax=Ideonella sp. TaxID=1929293 RepID=UPI003BB6AA04